MTLGWNEIKERAVAFSKEWAETRNEEADAKPFLVEFFNVFGISSRKVATFEHKVKKLDEHDGYIDLFWKGTILIEMKSRGKNLDKAYQQAKDYLPMLKQFEIPKYILVSDFENFRLYDLDENTETRFLLNDLVNQVHLFGNLIGYQKRSFKDEDPVNIEAAYLMGKLHDALKEVGYTGHELEKYLVRLLFCLFADDTTIFIKDTFQDYIVNKTNEDGTDLGLHLAQIFQVLNTPEDKRQKTLDESLAAFPYVNGQLFEEQLSFASFNSKMRKTLIDCCNLDWGKISPAIFGSMFQSVMDVNQRRNLGAHYTSEKNILKLIKPLFLDKLWQEFDKIKNNQSKLKEFHLKISNLRFLDPACGCGNFLVITYRELRLLELEVLKVLQKGQQVLDLESLILCNVDRFYGIEYEDFPSQIAKVALWLIDHQMNMLISEEFGKYFVRLPLNKSAMIIHGNALSIDWDSLLISEKTINIHAKEANIFQVNEPEIKYGKVNVFAEKINITEGYPIEETPEVKFDYIMGNPPFIGSRIMDKTQKQDLINVFDNAKDSSDLDYVTAWYIKAAKYIQDTQTKVAFVSTNSIVQGIQTSILWGQMLNKFKIKIHFAHRTFKWSNEAKGNAAVYCVIIAFANFDINEKSIFEYEDIKGEAHELKVKNINPYLVDAKDIFIAKRRSPICNVPEIIFGNMPNDGGNFLLDENEFVDFISKEPLSEKYIKPFLGAQEFLNGQKKYCLWFENLDPKDLDLMPNSLKLIKEVERLRKNSSREATRRLSLFPALFGEIRQPKTNFILIPRVSSENRKIIPMSLFTPDNIIGDTCLAIPNSTLYHLGILQSAMHMSWVNAVCGRLESRYRYSNEIVYNNYPWPENITQRQIEAIEKAIKRILEVRIAYSGNSLSVLYDTAKSPPNLVKAHIELDKAVDLAYRPQPFINDAKRMEFIFELYEKYTAGLFTIEKKKRKKSENI